MSRFTKDQPKDGETVLHCGHLDAKNHHFFAFSDGENMATFQFARPDGTQGAASWMVLCEDCFEVYGDKPECAMRADAVWKGDAPIIKQPEGPVQ